MMTMFTIDWTGPLTRCWCGLRNGNRFPVAHEMVHRSIREFRRMFGEWPTKGGGLAKHFLDHVPDER